ncbi:MAG TPA: hypothetical protein VJ302_35075 [Blastocatellia bacterium]|nr:hypothetical protein [Blastocatellia bacterium]
MPRTRRNELSELIRLALIGLDAQIVELQGKRVQLAAMADQRSTVTAAETAAPSKRRKVSAATRARISAAAKARWATRKKAQAKNTKPIAKKVRVKAKP